MAFEKAIKFVTFPADIEVAHIDPTPFLTPSTNPIMVSSEADNIRGSKRTVKACDRCRLKKVKCDGTVPCQRCQQSDSICHFGVSANTESKSVSAAHVNQLQLHNEILVKAIRMMWDEYAKPALGEDATEDESIHSITRSIGMLDQADHLDVEDVKCEQSEIDTTNSEHSLSGTPDDCMSPDPDVDLNSSIDFISASEQLPIPDLVEDSITPGYSTSSASSFHPHHSDSVDYSSSRKSSLDRPNRPTQIQMPPPFRNQLVGGTSDEPEPLMQNSYVMPGLPKPTELMFFTPGADFDDLVNMNYMGDPNYFYDFGQWYQHQA